MKDVFVFIVENEGLAKELIKQHFSKEGITYAAIYKKAAREAITEALDTIKE